MLDACAWYNAMDYDNDYRFAPNKHNEFMYLQSASYHTLQLPMHSEELIPKLFT